jgi:hypothetical protein
MSAKFNFKDFITGRYTDGGAGINNLDFSNIAKDLGAAGAIYGILNPNDSSGLASFFGTGGQQQPVGYTGGIPNYTATRELAPNAFASTYTTPDGEVAPRRPGMAGRRYFTDTQFTQSTDEPFMGVTKEQIAAQNQAAIDDQAFFESILGNVETESAAARAAEQANTDTTGTATTDTTGAGDTLTLNAADGTTSTTGSGMGPIGTAEQIANNPAATTTLTVDDSQTPRQRYTEILDTQVDASQDGLDEDEQKLIAAAITKGGFGIDEIATRYGAQPIDVVEGLLRGEFQTPEQVAAMYPTLDEPMLIATLLDQGKTTPEEVAAYYKDHPVYGGITPEQVVQEFRARGGEREFAQGGNVNGYYLGGPTDGMADQIPATINNMQPAALSDGEFVIPADVVSHLGNGNSDSGAKNLYSMMDRIRQDRTGTTKQGRQIDPNKYLA